MKDKYLFKGRRSDNGEWVTGFYSWCEDNSFINVHESVLVDAETNSYENYLIPYNVDPNKVCQSTGLRDMHNRIIFENDIVAPLIIKEGEGGTGEHWKYTVFFDQNTASFSLEYKRNEEYPQAFQNPVWCIPDFEYVGNILEK